MNLASVLLICALTLHQIYWTEGIISGRVAVKGQFPYAVKILSYHFYRSHDNNSSRVSRFICSGSILHQDYVLTSAGCFQRLLGPRIEVLKREARGANGEEGSPSYKGRAIVFDKYSPTYIRGGAFDGWISQEPGYQERRGNILIVHPDYVNRSTMFDVDVALIQLKTPWNLTQDPSQVSLAPRLAKRIKPDDFLKCSIAGFGYMSPEDFIANRIDPVTIPEPVYGNVLRYFYGRVAREAYCKYLRREFDGVIETFDDFYACALPMNKTVRQGSCHGDVGGPVVCYGLLTGLLSQYRAIRPCDNKSRKNTAFSIFTSLGAAEVIGFLREHIPSLPQLEEVPQGNPWDDYYEP